MSNVEELIRKSLQELQKISCENKIKSHENNSKNEVKPQESKLIFPKYRDNSIRISEQEARLLLIREIEKQNEFYYSVETPTKNTYSDFSDKSENPKINPDGRSGNIDLTLYQKHENEFKRTHLVEFKNKPKASCKKDFLKLLCDDENCGINYYINIIKNSDNTKKGNLETTIKDLEISKYQEAVEYVFEKYESKVKSKLKIFVCILNDIDITENNIIEYQIIDKENRSIKELTERIK